MFKSNIHNYMRRIIFLCLWIVVIPPPTAAFPPLFSSKLVILIFLIHQWILDIYMTPLKNDPVRAVAISDGPAFPQQK